MDSKLMQVDPYRSASSITGRRIAFSNAAPYIQNYVTSNLTSTSDPAGIYASRVQGRQLLLENPVRDASKKKKEEDRRERIKSMRKRKKLKVIGKREVKEKGMWKLDKSQAKYQLFVPLHRLWMSYISELLGLSQSPKDGAVPSVKDIPSSASMHPKLIKADIHGSIITVSQSKNPCLVGLSGIVIHETENAFKIITQNNAVKLLPKRNSIFILAIPLYSTLPPTHTPSMPLPLPQDDVSGDVTVLDAPHLEFDLYGNQFCFRSAERAGRKFKHKETIEL